MKKLLIAVFLTITLGCAPQTTVAQMSYPSEFYSVDSLYIEVNWIVPANHQLQWSVNRFTESSFFSCNTGDGVWLYNNDNLPTTGWEKENYSNCQYWVDTLPRPDSLPRVNTIQVRLKNLSTGKIVKDSIYHFFILGSGNAKPYNVPIFIETTDSSKLVNVLSRYDEDIEEKSNLQVYCNGRFEINKKVDMNLPAGSSACRVVKPSGWKKDFQTSLFGALSYERAIKFRIQGTGPSATHNTGIRVLNHPDWPLIGGVKDTFGVLYRNGVIYSFGFPQEKPNEHYIARKTGVNKDSVLILAPLSFDLFLDRFYDTLVYIESMDTTAIVTVFEIDTTAARLLGFEDNIIAYFGPHYEKSMIIVTNPVNGRLQIVAGVEEGPQSLADTFQVQTQKIWNLLTDTVDRYYKFTNLFDKKYFLGYTGFIFLLSQYDALNNNVLMAMTPRSKSVLIITDLDDTGVWQESSHNNWPFIKASNEGFIRKIVNDIVLKDSLLTDWLFLVTEDINNSVMPAARTVPIVDQMEETVIPYIQIQHDIWGGQNGGLDSTGQRYVFSRMRNYYTNRQSVAFQILTNEFFPEKQQIVFNDLHKIQFIFDSIPPGIVSLDFNSFENIGKNWKGEYFNTALLHIDYNVLPGWNVIIKELPDSGKHFLFSLDSNQQITFVIRQEAVLPVELVSFTCSPEGNGTRLSWQTVSELNNSHFVIEKSEDAIVFDSVGLIEGSGTSNVLRNYSFFHEGNGYYRLRQVDINGQEKTTDIIDCRGMITDTPNNQLGNIEIFPNPTAGTVIIKNAIGTVTLIDVLGRQLFSQKITRQNNMFSLELVPAGMYYVRLETQSGTVSTYKVLKE